MVKPEFVGINHSRPHKGRWVHVIFRVYSRNKAIIGIEGRKPRRGGWGLVWFFRPKLTSKPPAVRNEQLSLF